MIRNLTLGVCFLILCTTHSQACSQEERNEAQWLTGITKSIKKAFKIKKATKLTFRDSDQEPDGEQIPQGQNYAILEDFMTDDYYAPGNPEDGASCSDASYEFRTFESQEGKRHCSGIIKSEYYSSKIQVLYKDCKVISYK